jgi:hypothetical protein
MDTWTILRTFLYFTVIRYIFQSFGIFYQGKSGNPEPERSKDPSSARIRSGNDYRPVSTPEATRLVSTQATTCSRPVSALTATAGQLLTYVHM